jgi:diguanylate cyclase (GGDEF)-like protein/PAS domain S-box-containing protein
MFPSWLPRGLSRLFRRSDAADNDLRSLVENSRDVLCRLGPDHRIRYCSPSCAGVLGRSTAELMGRLPSTFVVEEDRPIIADAVARVTRGEEAEPTTVRVLLPDGGLVWVETTTRTVRDDQGRPREFILVMRDVTERQALRLRLEQEAVTDPLTGLANRRAFDNAVEREWARAVRSNSEMSLILLDLDGFKTFNDRYGHAAGDDALRRVAAAVQGVVRRPGDLAVRYGGEELAVILPRTPPAGASRVACTLRAAIEALQIPHSETGFGVVTASLGVATAAAPVGRTISMPQGLLIGADGALYRAKANGRNRVETVVLLAPKGDRRAA